MEDKLFDTVDKRKKATAKLNELITHPGWKLICDILDANIENVKAMLEDSESEETIEEVKRNRDKLKIYRKLRNTPEDLIREFTQPQSGTHPDLDPFPHDLTEG